MAPRNEGEKRRDGGRVAPMGKALWGPSTPRLLLFKRVLEKIERLLFFTDITIFNMISGMGRIFRNTMTTLWQEYFTNQNILFITFML